MNELLSNTIIVGKEGRQAAHKSSHNLELDRTILSSRREKGTGLANSSVPGAKFSTSTLFYFANSLKNECFSFLFFKCKLS